MTKRGPEGPLGSTLSAMAEKRPRNIAAIIRPVDVLGEDLVAVAIADKVVIAVIQYPVGLGMEIDEGFVSFLPRCRVKPRLPFLVEDAFVDPIGGQGHRPQGILADESGLELGIPIHELDRVVHVDDRLGIDLLRDADIGKHLPQDGHESLVDGPEKGAIDAKDIVGMAKEVVHLELPGQGDVDLAFEEGVPVVVLSRDLPFLVEPREVEDIGMGFPVEKIVGKLA